MLYTQREKESEKELRDTHSDRPELSSKGFTWHRQMTTQSCSPHLCLLLSCTATATAQHVGTLSHTHSADFLNQARGWQACQKPVHTAVCLSYSTCTHPQLPSCMAHTLIISCLFSVSLSPLLQWCQCACDKGFESNSWSLNTEWKASKTDKSWRCQIRFELQWEDELKSKLEWGWIQAAQRRGGQKKNIEPKPKPFLFRLPLLWESNMFPIPSQWAWVFNSLN